MPLTSLFADAFGAVTLFLVILFTLAGASCFVYVLYFRSQIRRENLQKLRDFNAPWIIRLILVLFAILWVLGELLRLPLLRKRGWLLHSLNLEWQENVCRLYILSSLGILEPGFFLTLFFLVHCSLHHNSCTHINRWNKRVLISVLLLCFPTFIAQFCFEVISPSIEFQKRYSKEKEGYGGKIPKYFTTVFKEEDSMAFCTYPLFSVIVHGVFVSLFVTYFLFVAMKMISFAINKGLERRILGLIFAIVGLLPSRVLFLGCSIMSKPGEPAFEVLVFLGFLALLLCTAVCVGILVLWPIADSLAVHWIFESKEVRMREQQSNIIPTEQYSRPLSVFVGDSDDDFSVGASQSLLGTASSSVEKDSDSLPRGGSISFRTMLRDVSLEPAENVNLFPDISRMHVFPPDSPPLPGKPMTPFLERGLP